MFIGYMIYSIAMGFILLKVGLINPSAQDTSSGTVTIETFVSLIFLLVGEELLKFISLMFLMWVIHKFSDNINLTFVISAILAVIGFGLVHYNPSTRTLASVLILQGAGSMFEMYRYYKTKNIFVPYITHLLTDLLAIDPLFLQA